MLNYFCVALVSHSNDYSCILWRNHRLLASAHELIIHCNVNPTDYYDKYSLKCNLIMSVNLRPKYPLFLRASFSRLALFS